MFERYTEKARRVIFFARYEASEAGSPLIEAQFILLGILRESPQVVTRWLEKREDWTEVFRKKIADAFEMREKFSTSVDLPLSEEAKRVLAYAAEEAERLAHRHIGTEHLFLALLRESESPVCRILRDMGVDANTVRVTLAKEGERDQIRGGMGWGIAGSGQRSTVQQRALQVSLVIDEAEKPLHTQWPTRIPAVGEILSLSEKDGNSTVYQVTKVEWQATTHQDEFAVLSKVVIHVSKA